MEIKLKLFFQVSANPGFPGDVPNWRNYVSMLSLASMVEGVNFFDRSLTDRLDSIPLYTVYGTKAFSKDEVVRWQL
jgi:hypothetical protein